jgi:hypothetical protein
MAFAFHRARRAIYERRAVSAYLLAASRCNRPGSQLNVRAQADFRLVPIQLAEGRPLAEQLGNSSAPQLHYETLDSFPSAARGLGARSMTQSAVHGSSSEGSLHRSLSISTRRAAPLSHRSVAVKRTDSDTSIGSFSHRGKGLEANAPARAPGSPSRRRSSSPPAAPSRRRSPRSGARARARRQTRRPSRRCVARGH